MTDSTHETGRGEAAGPQRGSLVGAKSATGADVAAKAGNGEPSLSRFGEIALGYARRGWKVFPIGRESKSRQIVKSWANEATDCEEKIRFWWSNWRESKIGTACGPSGLCVIDLDLNLPYGKDGRAELDDLELMYGRLPA